MSREIKFRAWDKVNKKMETVCEISYMDSCVTLDNGNELYYLRMYKEVDLMQYTELKDKNGKDIYEGDIVHFCNDEYQGLGEVVFNNNAFCLDNSNFEDELGEEKQEMFWYIGEGHLPYEVVGNIYENPELLNKGAV